MKDGVGGGGWGGVERAASAHTSSQNPWGRGVSASLACNVKKCHTNLQSKTNRVPTPVSALAGTWNVQANNNRILMSKNNWTNVTMFQSLETTTQTVSCSAIPDNSLVGRCKRHRGKKVRGVGSGDCGGHSTGPRRPIYWFGNVTSMKPLFLSFYYNATSSPSVLVFRMSILQPRIIITSNAVHGKFLPPWSLRSR